MNDVKVIDVKDLTPHCISFVLNNYTIDTNKIENGPYRDHYPCMTNEAFDHLSKTNSMNNDLIIMLTEGAYKVLQQF